jgi:hypothetical protein
MVVIGDGIKIPIIRTIQIQPIRVIQEIRVVPGIQGSLKEKEENNI